MTKSCVFCAHITTCKEAQTAKPLHEHTCRLWRKVQTAGREAREFIAGEFGPEALRYMLPRPKISAKTPVRRKRKNV